VGERQVGINPVDVPVQKVVHQLLIALCVLYNEKEKITTIHFSHD
jgi:hypothetical protein